MWWQKKYVSLMYRNVAWPTVLPNAQRHVPGQLVKKLLKRVIVIISPFIWSTYYGDDEVSVTPYLRVPDGWQKLASVPVDPQREVNRAKALRHDYSCVPQH